VVGVMEGFKAREGWTHWKVLSEDKRRKDMKNELKKRGMEMQRRKKVWEENNEIREKKLANGDEKDEGEGGTEVVREWADELKDMKAERISNKEEREPWVASPPSWDEEALLKRAEAAGMNLYPTFDDVPETQRRRCRESCFPPTQDEIAKFNLHRCMRCLPQDMDTGGFFVALFRKIAPLSERARRKANALALDLKTEAEKNKAKKEPVGAQPSSSPTGEEAGPTDTIPSNDNDVAGDNTSNKAVSTNDEKNEAKKESVGAQPSSSPTGEEAGTTDTIPSNDNDVAGDNTSNKALSTNDDPTNDKTTVTDSKGKVVSKPLMRGRGRTRQIQGLYDFVPLEGDILPPLLEFYGISDSFAREQFMARNEGNAKILYFITASVKKNLIDRGVQAKVQVVTSGLRAFERNKRDGVMRYRPVQESIHFVAPHMSKRKIIANLADFKNCINAGCIKPESFSESMAEKIKNFSIGAFVVALEGFETNVAKKMFLVMWRCRGDNGNSNCLVSKMEQDGMKSKLKAFGDDEEVGENVVKAAPVEANIDMSDA